MHEDLKIKVKLKSQRCQFEFRVQMVVRVVYLTLYCHI